LEVVEASPSPADLAQHFGPMIELDTGLGTTTADQAVSDARISARKAAAHPKRGKGSAVNDDIPNGAAQ